MDEEQKRVSDIASLLLCAKSGRHESPLGWITSASCAAISSMVRVAVLDRLAAKFSEVADVAPTDELAEAFRGAYSMFSETASKLREFPPEAAVAEAAELSTHALARLEELAPAVREFREKYCEGSGHV